MCILRNQYRVVSSLKYICQHAKSFSMYSICGLKIIKQHCLNSVCKQNYQKMEKSLRVLEKYGISNVEINLSTFEFRKAKSPTEQSHHHPSSELKSRQVSSSFINNFNEKLVYVGEPLENSEEFEEITKTSRRWRHIFMIGWSLQTTGWITVQVTVSVSSPLMLMSYAWQECLLSGTC